MSCAEKRRIRNTGRIELLLTGHGEGSKHWYLLHKVFPGDVSNSDAGAWISFYEWTQKGGLTLRRAQDGRQFTAQLVLIDCADTENADAVFSFCENRMLGTFACRGMGLLPEDKKKRGTSRGAGSRSAIVSATPGICSAQGNSPGNMGPEDHAHEQDADPPRAPGPAAARLPGFPPRVDR